MGCGTSSQSQLDNVVRSGCNDASHRVRGVMGDDTTRSRSASQYSTARISSIHVIADDLVRPVLPEGDKNIICLFGGPHSQKGAVAEHLVKRCGLVLISLETLLMRYLAATAKHPSFRETLDLIEAPDITLTWEIAMDLLLNEIRRSKSRFILVDLIPNMNKLLRCASLFHNAAKTFAQYDHEELHCRFAVHLIDEVAVATKTSKASSTTNADEMNPAFKKKRSVAFTSRVGPLLNLFSASQRLVTIKRISPGGEVEGELVAYLKHWSEYRIVSKSFDKQLPQPQQRGRVIWNI
eukprot:m.71829 g.71829  ORF g.71829 m.71829 type:complete len:294 (-) comp12316_c0_seq6:172-1053(-)